MHIDVENQNQQSGENPLGTPLKKEERKGVRYKIDWKKFGFLLGGLVLLGGLIIGGILFLKEDKPTAEDPVKVYDVAVILKDQNSSNPEEDARSSLKAGDIVLARETGREWSSTEKISFLILKMKLKQSEANKLTEPQTKKLSEKEAIEQGLVTQEQLDESYSAKASKDKDEKEMKERELEQMLTQIVRARKYRISFEKLEFDPEKIREGQPFMEREFGWEIVEKK